MYKKDGNLPLLSETGDYPNSDDMYKLYQWLQEETDYLVNTNDVIFDAPNNLKKANHFVLSCNFFHNFHRKLILVACKV